MTIRSTRGFLLASDFDQTLSFNDSGIVLADLLGVTDYQRRVDGLSHSNLVQQGGELAYLIRHDPDFRVVRREHLIEAGKRVRMKAGVRDLVEFLARGIGDVGCLFYVISAAPREVVISALAGVVPPEHIYGTELVFDPASGEVTAIKRVPAGFGKVAVIEELVLRLAVARERTIYVGDGNSDVHVMLHVNSHDGFTIAVSENRQLARIATSYLLGNGEPEPLSSLTSNSTDSERLSTRSPTSVP